MMKVRFTCFLFFTLFLAALNATTAIPYTTTDFPRLLKESIEKNGAAGNGLILIVRKNGCSRQPEDVTEMDLCMGSGLWDPSRSGFDQNAGIVTRSSNPYGFDDNVTMLFTGFFYVAPGREGDWRFRIDSQGATDLFIDGRTVADWYGEHALHSKIR